MKLTGLLLGALLGLATLSAHADVTNAEKLAIKYTNIAKSVNPEYKAPSISDGKLFFNRKFNMPNGKEVACASCHTSNPADEGKHLVTGKPIKPLSPAVNKFRFTDIDKVEDKFTEHCTDILGADCSAAEKANFIAFVMTQKTPSKK
jgi:mono/diheme cytochrome c family protein